MGLLVFQELDHLHKVPEEGAGVVEGISLLGDFRLFLFALLFLLLGLVGLWL
jgi:hypothetical protein